MDSIQVVRQTGRSPREAAPAPEARKLNHAVLWLTDTVYEQ